MENKPESKTIRKHKRREAFRLTLRCSRTLLLCSAGMVVTGLFVLPAALALQGAPTADSGAVVLSAPAPIGTAIPQPTPTPYVPDHTPNQAQTVAKDAQAQGEAQYRRLQFGDTDAAVIDIQTRLMELGYFDSDEPTEYFGPATEAAAKRFQNVHHMAETGIADEQLQSVLFSDNALPYVLEEGYEGGDVKKLQRRLDELGYYDGNINGYFGTATVRALTAFQKKSKLTESARLDADTSDILYSVNAKPKIDATPTPTKKPTPTPKSTKKPSSAASPTPSSWSGGGGGGGGSSSSVPVTGSGVDGFLSAARAQLGDPYKWGDEGPDSFDCSGLVVYGLASVNIKMGRLTASGFSQVGSWQTIASKDDLQPGDLIFFWNTSYSKIYHTGIWLGGNSYIHASSTQGKVVISSWSSWASTYFSHGKRIF